MEKDPQHIINLVTRYRNMANKIQQILIVAISLETGRLVGTSTKLNQFYHGGLVTKLCPIPVTPWTVACQILCPTNFPDKNTRLGCISFSRVLPDPETKGASPTSEADSLAMSLQGSP